MSDHLTPNPFDVRIKSVFRHRIVARDLMPYLERPFEDALELHRIAALPQEWIAVGPDLERRLADLAWLIHDRDGRPQMAVLLECQSRYDASMSRRMADYTVLLGQALARQGLYRADGSAVPILSAVFHAGPYPWTIPWERIATSPDRPQAVILQPGLTIDIHAYADDERPPRNLVSCMIELERGRYRWAREAEAFAQLLRYVDEELQPLLQAQPPELEQDFVAYIVAGYRSLFPDLDFAESDLRSLQALRHKMITLAETYQRERQAGEQKGQRTGEQEGRRIGEQEGRRIGEQEGRRIGEQEGRRIGEQEGRHKTLLSERAEYVRLFWGAETSQAFRQRLPAMDVAFWPSLSDLHAAYQAGRDPLQLLGSSNGLAPKLPGDSDTETP